MGIFSKIFGGLKKTKDAIKSKLSSIFVESAMCKIFGMTFPKVLKRTFLCLIAKLLKSSLT